ncbi:glucosidase II beta subunit, putative [Entamoeba invadens IP1]|uniref:Glucosidase II beta subunit, putative n=1 Tax=Entamoeba invadens IP1 TaxID=370355 RepID=A0A0A1U1F6_ENTIV|nr:glucosidase II beta subunit, putative [Entamoeba invadens IP1]ELP84738.1 glucosidase II beta subunit, putative [Entamoeba invadens IP1]|eukprot:XP_004184084.1 glucosidase II beta subunit, putative [Entamoeba invadens IP1]
MIFLFVYSSLSFLCGPSGVNITDNMIDDGYCDCPELNDEPTTGGCSTSNNKNYFECKNHGVSLQKIHYNRVNDKVCDCDDGTDERYGFCDDIVKTKVKENLHKLQEKREKKSLISNERDTMTRRGVEIVEKVIQLGYKASDEIEKMRQTEQVLENERKARLVEIFEEERADGTLTQQREKQIEEAKNYFVSEVIPFGLKEDVILWFKKYDFLNVLSDSNPEGINDKTYCLIRQKLSQIRSFISDNDRAFARNFAFQSAKNENHFCVLGYYEQCYTYSTYKMCIGENITNSGKVIGLFRGAAGKNDLYTYSQGDVVTQTVVVSKCGEKNGIHNVKSTEQGKELMLVTPCACTDDVLFDDIDKQIKEVKDQLEIIGE